jgi:bacterioferritin
MKPKEGVVDRLNEILTIDLTAVNQYFVQAEMVRNWGFERLFKELRELSFGEMKDSQTLVRHILYLEGLPNLQRLGNVKVGESVEEDLRLDLESEVAAVNALAEAIRHCTEVGDFTTRDILEEMIRDEEEHVDWLETQLETIAQVGIANYLAQQING